MRTFTGLATDTRAITHFVAEANLLRTDVSYNLTLNTGTGTSSQNGPGSTMNGSILPSNTLLPVNTALSKGDV